MIARAAAIVALIGSIATGIYAADVRYVQAAEYKDFQWSILKQQLRDLREDMRSWRETTGTIPHDMELDYQELLDLFCRRYPEDRECH